MQNTFSLFAGIDVSKSKIDVCLLDALGTKGFQEQFANTQAGMKHLQKWIESRVSSKEQVLFCLEYTGIYTMPLCLFLSRHQFHFAMVPALEIKRSVGVKRGKSDRIDARAIALYALLRKQSVVLYQMAGKKLLQLKHLLTHRQLLVKMRSALYVTWKESEAYLPKDITAPTAKQSKALLKSLDIKIKSCEAAMVALIQEDERMKELHLLLLSVPGIGPLIAAQLLVQTRCFTLFDNARKFACYSGVVPFEHTSGSSMKSKARVSHLANKRIKTLLNLAVLTALKKDRQLKAYYERKLAQGKNKMLVLNNCRNKLLHRIFATIKRRSPYVLTMQYAA